MSSNLSSEQNLSISDLIGDALAVLVKWIPDFSGMLRSKGVVIMKFRKMHGQSKASLCLLLKNKPCILKYNGLEMYNEI